MSDLPDLTHALEASGLVDVAYTLEDSPVGRLLLAATPRGLVRVAYLEGTEGRRADFPAADRVPGEVGVGEVHNPPNPRGSPPPAPGGSPPGSCATALASTPPAVSSRPSSTGALSASRPRSTGA